MKILLLNAGSSSLKVTLAESLEEKVLAHGTADWAGASTRCQYTGSEGKTRAEEVVWKGHARAVEYFVALLRNDSATLPASEDPAAVGHRVVHGGEFTNSVRINDEVRSRIVRLADIAPLHNPPSLATLSAAESAFPNVPQVAVFDTAFHSTLSAEARAYAIPERWTNEWGVRRYGFHGLSYSYCSRRAAELLGRPLAELKLVICHLGHGCSAAAISGGKCAETTMGFTPLDGLVMATRCGSIDPGVVLHVQRAGQLSAEEVETVLYRESGLLGLSGISGDMRQILVAAQSGDGRAQLAPGVYTRRIRLAIGALTTSIGGVDALVFTAGVGEHSAEVRRRVCEGLEYLSLNLDAQINANCQPDCDVSRTDSQGRILVVATREDVSMLREVVEVLGRRQSLTADAQ